MQQLGMLCVHARAMAAHARGRSRLNTCLNQRGSMNSHRKRSVFSPFSAAAAATTCILALLPAGLLLGAIVAGTTPCWPIGLLLQMST